MDTKDKLIEKQKELLSYLRLYDINDKVKEIPYVERLELEIASLEKQIEERKPIEDRSAEIIFNDGMDDEEQESKSEVEQIKEKYGIIDSDIDAAVKIYVKGKEEQVSKDNRSELEKHGYGFETGV